MLIVCRGFLPPPGAVLRQLPQAGAGQGRLRSGHTRDETRQGDSEDHFWGEFGISHKLFYCK